MYSPGQLSQKRIFKPVNQEAPDNPRHLLKASTHLISLCSANLFFFFNKLKVCGNLESSKSIQ